MSADRCNSKKLTLEFLVDLYEAIIANPQIFYNILTNEKHISHSTIQIIIPLIMGFKAL